MPNVKISELPSTSTISSTDLLAIVQAGTTKKTTRATLLSGVGSKSESFVNHTFGLLFGTINQALTWTAAQIFQAAVSIVASLSSALLTINQSGSGDIIDFQDAGVSRVRLPDGGGVVLVAQAGGFSAATGLLGYDSTKKRLVLVHESHNGPVPVDPRNGCVNRHFEITY